MRPPDEALPGTEMGQRRTVAEVLRPLMPAQTLRGPVLFVAAHPDDVLIGASWLLRASPGAHVVHVTDGSPRDASLRGLGPRGRRAASAHLRQQEAFAALSLAGLPRDHLLFLGAVEQEAALELVPLTECLMALLKALRPSLLVVHPYEGGHPDHDAAAFISHAAVALMARSGRTPPALLEMTSFHRGRRAPVLGEFLPTPDRRPESTVLLSETERDAKRRMLECYTPRARDLKGLPMGRERYRLAPRYDFTRPPHEGALQYESASRRMTGARWRQLARRALEELKLPETPWH